MKKIALSFDDGPYNDGLRETAVLLEKLREFNKNKSRKVTVSFFVQGYNIEKNRGLFQEIIKDGHEIGNHAYHQDSWWKKGKSVLENTAVEAVVKNHKILLNSGINCTMFRPPTGRWSAAVWAEIKKQIKTPYYLAGWDEHPETGDAATQKAKFELLLKDISNTDPKVYLLHERRGKGVNTIDDSMNFIAKAYEKVDFVRSSELINNDYRTDKLTFLGK
jgi:peptidoglycan-N-acetylglucosamine deacetylase